MSRKKIPGKIELQVMMRVYLRSWRELLDTETEPWEMRKAARRILTIQSGWYLKPVRERFHEELAVPGEYLDRLDELTQAGLVTRKETFEDSTMLAEAIEKACSGPINKKHEAEQKGDREEVHCQMANIRRTICAVEDIWDQVQPLRAIVEEERDYLKSKLTDELRADDPELASVLEEHIAEVEELLEYYRNSNIYLVGQPFIVPNMIEYSDEEDMLLAI